MVGIRHLPPTAVPIRARDLQRGLAAWFDPVASLERFRRPMASLTGCPDCFLVSSGGAALTLILLTLRRLADRTEVVVPAYNCPTVVEAVLAAGLEPVFCDVSPETLDFDHEALERSMRRRPLAVVPTHLYGVPHRIEPCSELGRRHGVFIVEDAAQSFGATVDGRMAGTLADAGFYSFGRGKSLPIGRGGLIVAGPRLAAAIGDTIRQRVPERPQRGGAAVAALLAYAVATRPAGWWFIARSPMNPASEGMDETRLPTIRIGAFPSDGAGIGLSLLERLELVQAGRRQNARRLMAALAPFGFVTLPKIHDQTEPVFLRLPLLVDRRERAERLFQHLWATGMSRSYYRTLPDLYARRVASNPVDFPGASILADRLLTLPTHPYLGEADVERIVAGLQTVGTR
jgi:perosamine synthetase